MQKIILSIAMLGIAIFSSSQLANAQIGIGIKGGINFSKLTNLEWESSSYKRGALTGIIVDAKINDNFAIQSELLYSFQGTSIDFIKNKDKNIYTYELNYIQIPLLLKLSYGDEKARIYINGGYWLGFLIFYSNDLPYSYYSEKNDIFSFPILEKNINKFDCGLAFSLGLTVKAGPGDFFIEGRYNHGLLDINKGEVTETPNYKPNKNMVINFSTGYILYFGGK
ncbi:MAG: PorT family protein [Cytophagales bacterium]|nr:MAG: PorT family protein [Cytophagales bacterium]